MALTDSEAISPGEVESALQQDQPHPNVHHFPTLGRTSSIYSLTLDEFQHTLCENGKNFGSMNMDEFLSNIWTAEENQANAGTATPAVGNVYANEVGNNVSSHELNNGGTGRIKRQTSLARQGSLTIPTEWGKKTVDEVWTEIHKGQQPQAQGDDGLPNPGSATRQPTFGEMTLEDFLVKAGVVREQNEQQAVQSQQHYGVYQGNNSNPVVASSGYATNRPMLGMSDPSVPGGGSAGGYQGMSQGTGNVGDSSGRNNGGYVPMQAVSSAAVYGGIVGNGGGYGHSSQAMRMVGPMSPVSSEGIAANVDSSGGQYGMDMGTLRGRKRIIDGPVEKVVERRQRRMIKNRESAARSRARKQAYTVELEAELNQLKEENKQLKYALAELEKKRNQQCFDELRTAEESKFQRAQESLTTMKRNTSCPL